MSVDSLIVSGIVVATRPFQALLLLGGERAHAVARNLVQEGVDDTLCFDPALDVLLLALKPFLFSKPDSSPPLWTRIFRWFFSSS
jgi:hypothetical protein